MEDPAGSKLKQVNSSREFDMPLELVERIQRACSRELLMRGFFKRVDEGEMWKLGEQSFVQKDHLNTLVSIGSENVVMMNINADKRVSIHEMEENARRLLSGHVEQCNPETWFGHSESVEITLPRSPRHAYAEAPLEPQPSFDNALHVRQVPCSVYVTYFIPVSESQDMDCSKCMHANKLYVKQLKEKEE